MTKLPVGIGELVWIAVGISIAIERYCWLLIRRHRIHAEEQSDLRIVIALLHVVKTSSRVLHVARVGWPITPGTIGRLAIRLIIRSLQLPSALICDHHGAAQRINMVVLRGMHIGRDVPLADRYQPALQVDILGNLSLALVSGHGEAAVLQIVGVLLARAYLVQHPPSVAVIGVTRCRIAGTPKSVAEVENIVSVVALLYVSLHIVVERDQRRARGTGACRPASHEVHSPLAVVA